MTIGIHRSPQEFAHEALHIGSPRDINELCPNYIGKGVRSQKAIAKDRIEEFRRLAMLIENSRSREAEIRSVMSDRRAVGSRLIIDSGHQDEFLAQALSRGFDPAADLPRSGVFRNHL